MAIDLQAALNELLSQDTQDHSDSFKKMTAAQKNALQFQGSALGLNPAQVVEEVSRYGTLGEHAKKQGFDEDAIAILDSVAPPDAEQLKGIKAEVFGDILNKHFNDYSDKASRYEKAFSVQGYTPKLMLDQLFGLNKKQQADFLTAQGLARDTAVQQVMMSNMRTGHFAVQAIEKALQHVTPGFMMVDTDVRRQVMNNIHKVFKEGLRESAKAATPKELFARTLKERLGVRDSRIANEGEAEIIRFQSDDGRTYSIPSNRQDAIEEATRRGWRTIQ